MPIVQCRGDERKRQIVDEYEIEPTAHTILLAGQVKQGCCGELNDRYYVFSYQSRGQQTDTGTFYVGDHCADAFLELIGHPGLPCFNPLAGNGGNGGREGGHGAPAQAIDPLNRELNAAVHLLIVYMDATPGAPLQNILEYVRNNPAQRAGPRYVKTLNTVVSRVGRGLTLRQIINNLAAAGNNLRQFAFPQINEVLMALAHEGIVNYVDP